MANVIKHKRGSGSDPSASDLILGELAIRTDTGKLFTKMDSGAIAEIAGGGSDIAINTLSSSSATGGGSATFNGSAYRFTLSAPPSVSAQQLLVSINGVIQKPVAGTGQPSEGFSVDGTDIILGDAPATGSDFFILTFKSLGVSEPADNSVTSAKIVDGAIVNADINASAAIAGSKINPNFGSQDITTTGELQCKDMSLIDTTPQITFFDTDHNPDFTLSANQGSFRITDSTNSAERLVVNSDGHVDVLGNLDVGAGLDVTGAITGTAAITLGNGSGLNWGDTSARIRGESGSSGLLRFDTNSSERMRIDSSGRLLLGTTTEGNISADDLTVAGSSDTGITVRSGTGNSGNLFFSDGTSGGDEYRGYLQYQHTTNKLSIGTNAVTRIAIDSSGNVGIGTTSPSHPLDVEVSSGDAVTRIHAAENNSASEARLRLEVSNDFAESVVEAYDSSGVGGSLKYNHGDNAWRFTTNNDNERMRITSTGLVGIGTTSPETNLHVQGVGDGMVRITSADGSSAFLDLGDASDKDGGRIQYNTDSSLRFSTASSERLRIDSSGNVGIGTTSPDARLEIKASNNGVTDPLSANNRLRFRDNDSTTTTGQPLGSIEFYTNDSGNQGIGAFICAKGSNTGQGSLHFATGKQSSSTLAERMTIDQSGNVGIGTTSPRGTLDVFDGSFVLSKTGTGTRNWRFLNNNVASGNLGLQVSTATDGTTFENVIEITKTGQVGIGTGSPHANLHIQGGNSSSSPAEVNIWGGTLGRSKFNLVATETGTSTGTFQLTTESTVPSQPKLITVQNSGDVIVGGTSSEAFKAITLSPDHDDGAGRITFNRANTSNVSIIVSMKNASSEAGRIEHDNTSCGIFSSSDYRLKENVVPISDGITRVKTLKPYRFNFKTNASKTVDGFFAHEVTAVPESVSGTKDEVDSDNNPVYQAIDQSKLVPLLTAALQEAIGRIEALEAK